MTHPMHSASAPGLMHMFPEAQSEAQVLGIDYPIDTLFCTVGFFAVMFLQQVLSPLLTPEDSHKMSHHHHDVDLGRGTYADNKASDILTKVGIHLPNTTDSELCAGSCCASHACPRYPESSLRAC